MWDFPGAEIEPVSPALAGGFLDTGPPGRSQKGFRKSVNSLISTDLIWYNFIPHMLLSIYLDAQLKKKITHTYDLNKCWVYKLDSWRWMGKEGFQADGRVGRKPQKWQSSSHMGTSEWNIWWKWSILTGTEWARVSATEGRVGSLVDCQWYMGFSGGSDSKESTHNAGGLGLIPGSGRSLREGNGYPLQYFCLENSMDRGAWRAPVHGITKILPVWNKRLRKVVLRKHRSEQAGFQDAGFIFLSLSSSVGLNILQFLRSLLFLNLLVFLFLWHFHVVTIHACKSPQLELIFPYSQGSSPNPWL